jgi:hypothetical protein
MLLVFIIYTMIGLLNNVTGQNSERSGHGLIWDIIPAFAWKYCEKPLKDLRTMTADLWDLISEAAKSEAVYVSCTILELMM